MEGGGAIVGSEFDRFLLFSVVFVSVNVLNQDVLNLDWRGVHGRDKIEREESTPLTVGARSGRR